MYQGDDYEGYGGASYGAGGDPYNYSDGYPGAGGGLGGSQDNENYDGGRNGDDKKRRNNNQSLIPISIKQIEEDCVYDTEQAAFIYNGYKLEWVHVMGRVVEHELASTLLQLKIQDNSSQAIISIQYYLKGQQDQKITGSVTEGAIFSCFGALKTYKKSENPGGLPYLNMYGGYAVTNEAEYRAHELSTRYTSLYNAKGPLRDLGKKSSVDTGYGGQNQMSSMYGNNPYQGGLASMMGGQGQNSEEEREKERVLSYMRQNAEPDSQGIALETILRELTPTGLTHEKIRKALNLLLDEGNVYTTIDDSTYAVTE